MHGLDRLPVHKEVEGLRDGEISGLHYGYI